MADKPTPNDQPTEEQPPAGAGEPPAAQTAQSGAEAPPAAYPPQPPAPKRPAHLTKTWIAAVAAAVLLLGGGVGGYFIGAANDHHDGRPGPGWHDQRGPSDGFRGDFPWRGGDRDGNGGR